MSKLYIDAQDYKEGGFGAIALKPYPEVNSTDNPLLFSATYLSLLPEDERSFEHHWFISVGLELEMKPGLYRRKVGSVDQNSHDNLIGLIIGSYLLEDDFVLENINRYAFWHLWFFNTEKPGWPSARSLMVKFACVGALLKASLDKWINPAYLLIAAYGFEQNKDEARGNTSGRCLLYLQSQVLLGKSPFLDKRIKSWQKKMDLLYPDEGPKELYSIYFGAEHFITKYAPTSKFFTEETK